MVFVKSVQLTDTNWQHSACLLVHTALPLYPPKSHVQDNLPRASQNGLHTPLPSHRPLQHHMASHDTSHHGPHCSKVLSVTAHNDTSHHGPHCNKVLSVTAHNDTSHHGPHCIKVLSVTAHNDTSHHGPHCNKVLSVTAHNDTSHHGPHCNKVLSVTAHNDRSYSTLQQGAQCHRTQ